MEKSRILKSVWIWNNTVTNFIKERIKGYSLNICCGKNPLCSVNIDLDPLDKSILKADMRDLPFYDNTFDTVVSDPPWKVGYYERMKIFFEAVRVCKIGGIIIYNAYWIPMAKNVELQETFIRQDTDFSNTSIISIFVKTKDETEIKNAYSKKEKIINGREKKKA